MEEKIGLVGLLDTGEQYHAADKHEMNEERGKERIGLWLKKTQSLKEGVHPRKLGLHTSAPKV